MTLVTAKDVKLLLHCDDQYIHRCRKAGMPYHREGGRIKYDMAEVYAWHRGEWQGGDKDETKTDLE